MILKQPKQVVLITVYDKVNDRTNIITIGWHSLISLNPLIYGIIIKSSHYSYELIREQKELCINFMSYEYKNQALICGTKSGRVVDKFKLTGLKSLKSGISADSISEAYLILECRVLEEHEIGDHVLIACSVINTVKRDVDYKPLICTSWSEFTTLSDDK